MMRVRNQRRGGEDPNQGLLAKAKSPKPGKRDWEPGHVADYPTRHGPLAWRI